MKDEQTIILNQNLISLIGFAQKARVIEKGFQATKRGIMKGKVAFLLLDKSIGDNSLKKAMSIAKLHKIPVLIVNEGPNQQSLFNIAGYKILGVHKGGLAAGFIQKLKQEYQWL